MRVVSPLILSTMTVRGISTGKIDKHQKSAEFVSAAVLSHHTHISLSLTPLYRIHYWRSPPSCAHPQWRF